MNQVEDNWLFSRNLDWWISSLLSSDLFSYFKKYEENRSIDRRISLFLYWFIFICILQKYEQDKKRAIQDEENNDDNHSVVGTNHEEKVFLSSNNCFVFQPL